jgi:GNAT superfamily N-acetyltransferase
MSVGLRTEHWRGEIGLAPSHRRPWVAEDATGRVIGFVAAGPARDDDLPPRTGEIYAIYVDPECWSHGVGTHLLQHALRDLKEAGEMSVALWCVAEHAPSRRFYAKHGWHADGATRIDTFADEQVDMVRYRHDIT